MSVPDQELLHARRWDLPAGWGPLPSKDRSRLSYYYTWVHQLSPGTSPVLANHTWAPPRQSAGPWGYTGPKLESGSCRRYIKAIQGLLPGNHRKGNPGPLSVARLAHLSSGDRAQTQVWSSILTSQMVFRRRPWSSCRSSWHTRSLKRGGGVRREERSEVGRDPEAWIDRASWSNDHNITTCKESWGTSVTAEGSEGRQGSWGNEGLGS